MFLNICVLTTLVAQSIGLMIGAALSVEVGFLFRAIKASVATAMRFDVFFYLILTALIIRQST